MHLWSWRTLRERVLIRFLRTAKKLGPTLMLWPLDHWHGNLQQCIRQSWWKSTFDTSTNLSNSSCCSSAAARHKKLDPHNTWPGVGRRYGPDIVNIFWKLWLTLSFTICIYVLGVVPEHLTLGKGNAKNGHTAWVPTERSTMPNRPEGPKPNLGSN